MRDSPFRLQKPAILRTSSSCVGKIVCLEFDKSLSDAVHQNVSSAVPRCRTGYFSYFCQCRHVIRLSMVKNITIASITNFQPHLMIPI